MPEKAIRENTKEKMVRAILKDDYCTDEIWYLELTESQIRLLKWLDSNEMLHEELSFKILTEQDKFERI